MVVHFFQIYNNQPGERARQKHAPPLVWDTLTEKRWLRRHANLSDIDCTLEFRLVSRACHISLRDMIENVHLNTDNSDFDFNLLACIARSIKREHNIFK